MATINFCKSYLEKLTQKDSEELSHFLTVMGFPVEILEEDKIAIDITPNRPDLLFGYSIKRLIENYSNENPVVYRATPSGEKIYVKDNVSSIRPYIAGMIVKNLKIDEEVLEDLIQFQEKLHITLGRKRKKIAIGLHDLARVKLPITYSAHSLEEVFFVPLDSQKEMTPREILNHHPKGIEYSHLVSKACALVSDALGVIAFPPIINCERTRLTDKTDSLFVDITGTNHYYVMRTADLLACAFIDMGARVFSLEVHYPERVDTSPELWDKQFSIPSVEDVANSLGISVSESFITRALLKMGHRIEDKKLLVPPYRIDVSKEIDIHEDIAIVYGYNNIPKNYPELHTIGELLPQNQKLHETMLSLGFSEVLTWILGNEKKYSDFFSGNYVKTVNALTEEFNLVRPILVPNILEVFRNNKTFELPQKLYEIGPCACKNSRGITITENICFGIMANEITINELIGYLNGVYHSLKKDYTIIQEDLKGFIPGRCARIFSEKHTGLIGEVHPEVLEKFSIPYPVAIAEITLSRVEK